MVALGFTAVLEECPLSLELATGKLLQSIKNIFHR